MNKPAEQNAKSSALANTLRNCEAGFLQLLGLLPVAVYVCDRDGRIIEHNPAAVSLWGRAPRLGEEGERFCGSFRIFRPDGTSLPHEQCPMAVTLCTGQPIRNAEIVIERPDGSRATAIVNATPIKNDRGEVVGAINSLLDITERKRTELVLRESEWRQRAVLESALDAIITMDHRGQIVEFNPAAERMFGHSRSAAIGHDMAELIIPAALRERHRAGLARFLASGEGPALNQRLEFSALRRDGLEFPIELSIVGVGQSDPPLFTGFIRDITKRKRRERQLAALASLGRRLNATKDITSAGRIIVEVADELLGWDACSLILYDSTTDQCRPVFNMDLVDGVKVDVPFAYTAKPPSPRLRKVIEAGAELILRESAPDWTPDLVPFGDTSRPSASLMFAPVRDGQQILGVLSIQSYRANAYTRRDLDALQALADHCGGALERIRSRERLQEKHNLLQTVMDHLPDYIYVKDAASRYLLTNAANLRLMGVNQLEDVVGRTVLDFWSPAEVRSLQADDRLVLGTGQSVLDREETITDAAGKTRQLLTTKVPLRDATGEVIGLVGVSRDITERKESEAERARLFNLSLDLLCVADFDGWLKQVNPAWTECLGWSAAELTSRPMLDFILPEDHEATVQARKRIYQGQPVRGFQNRYRHKDGSYRWLSWNVHPLMESRQVFSVARDTTEHKRLEAAHLASEAKFRSLVERSLTGIYIIQDGAFVYVNPKMTEILGFSTEELTSRPVLDFIAEADRPLALENIRRRLSGEIDSICYQLRMLAKNGREIFVEVHGGWFEYNGREAILGTMLDITDRKQAEAMLRRSERDLQLLTQRLSLERARLIEAQALAKVGSWETELPSQNVTWSEETYRIFESDPLHFQPTHARFLAFVHPEDRAKVDAAFMESLDKGSPCVLEHRIVTPDGRVKFVEERWQTFADEHGRPVRAAGTCQDITERRRAEEQLREHDQRLGLMLEQFPALMWTTDQNLVLTSAGGSVLASLGVRAETLVGKNYAELHGEDSERTLAHRKALRGMPVDYQLEIGGRAYESRVAPFLSGSGEISGCIGVAQDVTERKRDREQLRESLEQLRKLTAHVQAAREEERSRISREVHDELGQMMTVLKMELTWLAGKLSPELPLLSEKTRQMKKLVEQVASTVSRIAMDLRPSVLDDLGLVAALEWQAEEFQARTGIACRLVSDTENLPLDAERATAVFRIFQEALTNVTRHANASRVEAWLRTQGRMLMLEVQDNGRGISPQEIAGTRSLGLVGMRERAALLGGTIRITGEAGKGTNLELTLPAQATSSPT